MKELELGTVVTLTHSFDGLPVGATGEIMGGDVDMYDIRFEFKSRGFNVPDKMVYNVPSEYIKMRG